MEKAKLKVLVIDDDLNMLDLLKSGLEVMGFAVTACENAAAAAAKLNSGKPDVILMDIGMPDVDGISLCRNFKISPETADIPVIMLTAYDDEKTFHDAMLFGANGFLTKPFEMTAVKRKIEECAAKAKNKKENKK